MAMREEAMRARMAAHMHEGALLRQQLITCCADSVLQAAKLMTDTFRAGGKILIAGNGGSAADSQHFAAEFMSRLRRDFIRPPLPAIALTTDTSFLTAFSNDENFAGVFARQIEGLGKAGDIFFGISTSGSSGNVVKAIEQAHKQGLHSIGLTGVTGTIPKMVTVSIAVPSQETQLIQEAHLALEHLLCEFVEESLFEGSAK